jgi:miniconductance mechanosensitive channel
MSFVDVQSLIAQTPFLRDLLRLMIAVGISLLAYLVVKAFSVRIVTALVRRTSTQYDDIIVERLRPHRLAYLAALLVLLAATYTLPAIGGVVRGLVSVVVLVLIAVIIAAILDSLVEIYEHSAAFDGTPIKGYVQMVKLFVFIVLGILGVSIISGRSPLILLSGLGAMTAVVMLIFQDTILSLVTSLQITSNDLIRVGDWITVPSFDADGDVIDVALHAVQIQNWDKSVSVIPTHKVLQSGFTNWRGMSQGQGRRIKRALNIDMTSVRLCDDEMLDRFAQITLIADYVRARREEVAAHNARHGVDPSSPVNGRQMTNLGTFRAYTEAYLRHNATINEDLTLMARQLAPGPEGIPLEIYAFSSDTNWVRYEHLQADIFDHLVAVLPEFDLRVFQNPMGADLQGICAAGTHD